MVVKDYVRKSRVPLITLSISLPKNIISTNLLKEIDCDITSYSFNPLRNTSYITAYLRWDTSNNLKSLILLVKRFVSSHKIHGAPSGFLSSYSWVMLVFHFLLQLNLIPPMKILLNSERSQNSHDNIEDTASFGFVLTSLSPSNLSCLSISQLFKSFLYYYTHEIDVTTDVITLRGNGEVNYSYSYS